MPDDNNEYYENMDDEEDQTLCSLTVLKRIMRI